MNQHCVNIQHVHSGHLQFEMIMEVDPQSVSRALHIMMLLHESDKDCVADGRNVSVEISH